MSFDWSEYLKIAQFLKDYSGNSFSQEAAFRCAVSRAYYTAFCHARNYARDKQHFVPKYTAEDHKEIRRHYLSLRSPKMSKVADKLDQLRIWRNNCDYKDNLTTSSLMAATAIKEAQTVLNIL